MTPALSVVGVPDETPQLVSHLEIEEIDNNIGCCAGIANKLNFVLVAKQVDLLIW